MENEKIQIDFKTKGVLIGTYVFTQKDIDAILSTFHKMAMVKTDMNLRKQLESLR